MKVVVGLPGRIRPRALEAGEAVYVERLRTARVEVIRYRPEKVRAGEQEQARMREGAALLRQVEKDDFLVVCDERGKLVSTEDVVRWLGDARLGTGLLQGRKRLLVMIGGAFGFDEAVRKRADAVWSLSGLVMAGGVARVVLLEALYRAVMVLDGHPYHNE
jgi:23S rRNA (pseudouridine1915-N3)-methyltransferase